MTTYVFPGQGSQKSGMGAALFPEFPDLIKSANQILGYSVIALCSEDNGDQLNKTSYTQPALYVVNALSYLKKIKETGTKPDFVAGHSLGEYSALFAAGVFDFETGLKLVQKRGDLMSQARGGSMAAIIGLHSQEVQSLLQSHNLVTIGIANYNTYTQTVISGPKDDISMSKSLFEEAGAMFLPLKVSGAFHSPLMGEAQQQYANFLRGFSFAPPTIPVIANVTGEPYKAEEIHAYLTHQITYPVRWTQSIEYLEQQGETVFEEIGSGTVLTGLIRRIQNKQ
jgi:malonyl CoA-acyl carrier protein transacylase